MKYTPDYSDRDTYYANKDRAMAEREAEKANKPGFVARMLARVFGPIREPVPHDYRREYWGHSLMALDESADNKIVKLYGFGCEIEAGDFLIRGHDNGWGSYKVDEIEYKNDPPDAFIAYCTWTPGVFEVDDEGAIVRCKK